MLRQAFVRRIDALDAIVAFTDTALARTPLDEAQRQAVHFTVEELFTNMVKYSATGAPEVSIEIDCVDRGAVVTLIDTEVEPFDPTLAPDANLALPIEQRVPGGLGLHVLRRLVDSFSYEYDTARREARTTFRVGPAESRPC